MTTDESTSSPWWRYILTNLDNLGRKPADLAKETGIDRSRFTDWRRGKRVSLDNARLIARYFKASPLEVLVAAGLLTEQEAQLQRARPDVKELSDEELIAELGRRLKRTPRDHPA